MALINKRYPYTAMERVEHNGSRHYKTLSGSIVPSVTTILAATKDKSHLDAWRKRVGVDRAAEITQEASSVGTRMHKYLEDYAVLGEWPAAGSNPYAKKANQMASIIRDSALVDIDEYWGLEVSLGIDDLYAGTTDVIAVYRGQPCICDFKQTNRPKKSEWVDDYRMQLVAYAECHNDMYGTEIQEGHVFMCSRDLEYQQFDIWPAEYSYWREQWYNRLYEYYENLNS